MKILHYQNGICKLSVLARLCILSALLFLAAGPFYSTADAQVVSANTSTTTTASLIAKLVNGLTVAEQAAVITRNGGVEKSSVPALRLHIVEFPAADLAAILAAYQADPQVQGVEINKTRKVEGAASDPFYSSQWALPKIGWDAVFGTLTLPGQAVVAVLDTGVDASHADLAGNVISGTSIKDGSNGMTDPNGHGTWMAGIIAALPDNNIGIAGVGYSRVSIMPVTVLGADGTGQDSDIIAGVMYAADHGADVILMSFSNPGFSQNLQDAIDYAWSKNIVIVAATGNDGVNTPTYPAGSQSVVGVSATDTADALVSFSNYGQDAFLGAPGLDILTTGPADFYITLSGTSASAAIVAGVSAVMRAADPMLTNGVIVGRLARTADPAGTQEQTGNGRVNMERALADISTDPIQPAGAPGGGPFVGPYVIAAESISATWTLSSSTISVNATGLVAAKNYQISYTAPGSSTSTFHTCFTGVTTKSDTLVLSSPYTTGSWSVRLDAYNNNNTHCSGDGAGQTFRNGTTLTTVNVTAKSTPTITWSNPADIIYPMALSSTQLNATADVAGSFVYTPVSGRVLNAGDGQSLKVDFTPTDTANYNNASKTVTINVKKGTPVITWGNPADIIYPTTLSGTQMNATADVAGSFAYTPISGTLLNAGDGQSLKVDFTPTDMTNYNNASKTVTINIKTASQTIMVTTHAPASAAYNTSFTVAATGGGSGNPVLVTVTGVCSVSSGGIGSANILMTSGTGTCTVKYDQTGDSNYNAATEVTEQIAAEKSDQTITFNVLSNKTAGDPAFGISASASSGLDVIFSSLTSTICIVSSPTVTITNAAGICTIRASQVGDGNYKAASDFDQSFMVNSGAAVAFSVVPSQLGTSITSITAGNSFDVTVTAKDLYNNIATGYTGTVHFTSIDPKAGLPGDAVFVSGDNGSRLFSNVVLETSGNQRVSASDVTMPISGSSQDITVMHASANTFLLVTPASVTAGTPFDVTMTVQDAYSNTVTDYIGTVQLISSDTNTFVVMPAAHAFTTGSGEDNGIHTFTGAILITAPTQTITASDGTISVTSGDITVIPGALDHFTFSNIGSQTALKLFSVTITPADKFENAIKSFTGTVDLTITSGSLISPLTSGSFADGVWTGDVMISGAGIARQITATNSSGPETGISNPFDVAKASATVTLGSLTPIYDGTAKGASATTDPLGLLVEFTYNGSPAQPISAGSYTVVGTINDSNYEGSATGTMVIAKADATCLVSGSTGTYDAAAHGASGSCTGVGGVILTGLNLGDKFTDVPGGTAHWAFTGGTNYNDKSGDVAIVINKADATCLVSGATGTYDAAAHGASGSCTGVGGVILTGLNLGDKFTDVPGGTAHWTFTGGTNYNDKSGDVAIVINKADATCLVSGSTGTYDAAAHGASGSCTGVGGVILTGLNLGDKFTDVPGGTAHWAFTGGTNYNDKSGDVAIVISKADATINVVGWTGTYNALAHGATGTASGVGGVNLSAGLNLGATFTDYPGGTAHWTFTGGINYNDKSGDVAIVISKADATINVVGWTGTYNALAHGATGTATGVGGVDLNASLNLGSSFMDYPGGTAHWTFTGGTNYNDKSGDVTIVISKATSTTMVTVAGGTTFIYDGNTHPAAVSVTGVGGLSLTPDPVYSCGHAPKDAADAGCIASYNYAGDVNHFGSSDSKTYAISKADPVMTATGNTCTYNGGPCAGSGTATGVKGESLSPVNVAYKDALSNLLTTAPVNAGTYSVAIRYAGDANYNQKQSAAATITITPKAASVTPDAATKIFGTADPALSGTLSGFLAADNVTASYSRTPGETVGTYAISAKLSPAAVLGNYNITYNTANFTITPWTTLGFYSPIDMNGVTNTSKGGSTVPMKFQVFSGATELTNTSAISSIKTQQISCTFVSSSEDPLPYDDALATGGTSLRYDGQFFIYNWKTPKSAGICFVVAVTTQDGSRISANFKLK